MTDPSLQLENQLCFLIYRLHRGVTDIYRPLLAELGLTYPQYLVMLALWGEDGQSVGELARRLDLDTGTLSPVLRRMQSADLLTRVRQPVDERSVRVHLTDDGRALRTKAAGIPAAVAARIIDDESDYWALRRELEALVAKVGKPGAAGDYSTIPQS